MMPPPMAFWTLSKTKRCAAVVEPATIFLEMFSASWLFTQMVFGERR